jgi:hypothetical protein
MIRTCPYRCQSQPVLGSVPARNGDKFGMIVRSVADNGPEGSGMAAFQDHPHNSCIGRVGPTLLIRLHPVPSQPLADLHRRLQGPARQGVRQTADQNGSRPIGGHPAQASQCLLFGRSLDRLRHGSDVVGDCETDDLLGGLPDRHARITYRMARVGAPRKAACCSEGPLTECLVPPQPAQQRMPLQIGRGDPPGIRSTGCCRGLTGGNDLGSQNHVRSLVDARQPHRGCVQRLNPADDVGSRTVGQPVPHHPSLAGESTGQRVASPTSHQTAFRCWTLASIVAARRDTTMRIALLAVATTRLAEFKERHL